MPDDFLFHSVSESEKEKIKKQAKAIMDSFAERLGKVKEKIPEPLIEREEFEREEKSDDKDKLTKLVKDKINLDFRERFFDNAPQKNKDFILTEKKKW